MKKLPLDEILPLIHEKLRKRYGAVEVVSGQGIAKGQRVRLSDGGKSLMCVIKTSSGGRISFGRRDDGTWSGLSECDRVVVVAPTSLNGDEFAVSMFDQAALVIAFEKNLAAQKEAGMGDLPCWLAPFHEADRGTRGTGDGFGDKATWTEALFGAPEPSSAPEKSINATSIRALTLAEAKQGLARTFGVSPEAVEITIRG